MEWTEENLLKLIEIYKAKSLLWDQKHRDYYKKHLKEDAWNEISDEMQISTDQCRKKMLSLLASHRRERNKVKSAVGTGKGSAKIYESRWFAYDAFKFLEDRDLPRRGLLTTETDGIVGVGVGVDIEEGDMLSEHNIEQEVTQREQETASPSSLPRTTERGREKEDNSSSMMKIAFNILKTTEKKLKREPTQRDEIDSFFDYVGAKVHKYSPETQTMVQHAIFDILTKADRGRFDCPTLSYQQPWGWPNSVEGGPTPSEHAPPYFSQPRQEVSHPADPTQFESSLSCNIKQSPAPSDDSESFEDFV